MLSYRFLLVAKEPLEQAAKLLRRTDPDSIALSILEELISNLDAAIKKFEEMYDVNAD